MRKEGEVKFKMMESKNLILRETTFGDCGIFSEWETKEDVKKFFSMDDDHGYEDVVRDFFTNVQDPSLFLRFYKYFLPYSFRFVLCVEDKV